jgi:hypothetical protein
MAIKAITFLRSLKAFAECYVGVPQVISNLYKFKGGAECSLYFTAKSSQHSPPSPLPSDHHRPVKGT